MSVLGIGASSLFSYLTQGVSGTNNSTNFQQEFQQLGQDLQSGNLSAAQSDFATLQNASQTTAATQSSSPIAQAFSKLSQDLQSGNLTAAQSDYSTLQQDLQTHAAQSQSAHGRHHHHHGGGDSNGNAVSQLFNELGSALQSGNLAGAQQTYSSLQQDLAQYLGSGSASSTGTSSVSVSG
jgi:outer membrane protein assembly factor BamD (BamD/ComL family)